MPRTVLGLRIAKLNTSSLCSPTPSLWTCTGSCLLYLAEGDWGLLARGMLLILLSLSPSALWPPPAPVSPLFIHGGEKNSGRGPPQSGLVTSDIPLDGLLSLDFCLAVYIVHFNTHCCVICHAPTLGFGDVIFRDHFSIERCYR